jgi:hypothetical protein
MKTLREVTHIDFVYELCIKKYSIKFLVFTLNKKQTNYESTKIL